MTDEDWKQMREAAVSLGEEYVEILDDMGKGEIEKLQAMVNGRFRGDGQVDMTSGEWLIAIRRYKFATEGRNLSEMETEKALRLVFQKQLLYDRISKQIEAIALTPAPDKKSDPLGSITVRNDFHKRKIRLRGLKDEKISQIQKGDTEDAISALDELVEFAREIIETAYSFTTQVAEYEVFSGAGKVDRQLMKDMQGVMEKLGKEIDALENKLGLKTDRSEETYDSKFNQTMQKAERFAKVAPRQYSWWCPVCNCETLRLMRKKADGELINKLDLWWAWKCPECGTVIAYDQEHPLFDGKLLFWRRAWDLVKWGDISLKKAAYLHECAPEHLVMASQQIYQEKLPPHVEKEWEEIEAQSRSAHKNDGEVQEALRDSGEDEE